jgi:hypothetical protein
VYGDHDGGSIGYDNLRTEAEESEARTSWALKALKASVW